VVVRAPAKINLALRVGDLTEDGYHDVVSVFQAVSLFEEVTASPAEAGEGITVTVRGPGAADVPTDGTNLAVRAARLLAERTGVEPAVQLAVRKAVPVAGGMAGGSADAAAALLACDLLWGTGLSRDDLVELGAELGSDVPFALVGGTALGTGRGDRVTSLLARGEYHWVLALAAQGLSTPAVYAECDRLRAAGAAPVPEVEPQVPAPLAQALRTGDAVRLGQSLVNDLQDAACSLRPELHRVLALARDHEVLGAMVSGSGPTVALLVPGTAEALELAVALTASGVASDVRRVTGPVPGARHVEPVVTSPHHPSHSNR
jgi:4-diphosphocytidyl-2-C-methyl-D-erythritol kinase